MTQKPDRAHNRLTENNQKITLDSNGMVRSKTPYVNGKKHGAQRWWYENGSKSRKTMWKNGVEHGSETWWGQKGQKFFEQTWKHGEKHGIETWWHGNNKRRKEAYYVLGKESAWILWSEEWSVINARFPSRAINAISKSRKPHQRLTKK